MPRLPIALFVIAILATLASHAASRGQTIPPPGHLPIILFDLTSTVTPTETPTFTPTPTDTPTETPTETATPSPTPTETPIPTDTPTEVSRARLEDGDYEANLTGNMDGWIHFRI